MLVAGDANGQLLVAPAALPANQSVNVAQWNGQAPATPQSTSSIPAQMTGSIETLSAQIFYKSSFNCDMAVMADTFKQAGLGNTGDFTIWTPTSGKKFRLLRATLMIPDDLIPGARVVVQLKDGTGGTNIPAAWVLGTEASALQGGGWFAHTFDFSPYGFISAAANNVLSANVSGANLTSQCLVLAYGVEQ